MAAEGDEVEVAFVLQTLEALGHVVIVFEMGGSGRAGAVALARDCPLMTKRCHEWGTRICGGWGLWGGFVGGEILSGLPTYRV